MKAQSRAERAESLHAGGSACSQAVVAAFAEDFGLEPELAHRISAGFGGGIGRKQLVCGALSGSVMVLGLAFGAESGAEQEKKLACYAKTAAFMEEMEERFGATDCRTLLRGVDLNTEEGRARMKEEGLSAKVCDTLIASCVRRLEEILGLEEGKE